MEDAPEGKFTVDFTRKQNFPFEIKSETSYDSWLARNTKDGEKTAGKAGSLVLGLKKSNCIAWVDIPHRDYEDHVIEAKIRIDSLGGYAATGVMFRIADQDSYYLALVSSKGYFRLDVVKENAPKTLIAWTDFFGFDGININLKIITYGTYLIFLVNEKWVGEVADDTIMAGRPGFALASYLEDDVKADASGMPDKERTDEYICKAWLDYFSVDTRVRTIEDQYKKWTDDSNINAEGRLRLAETFAVMGKYLKALDQIQRAWKRRDEVILSSSVSGTKVRTKKELLLAARMSFSLGQYNDAEEYIDSILEQWPDSPEGLIAHTEKIKILNELNKFSELKEFLLEHPETPEKDIDYYTMIARCHWELGEYADSAEAWSMAFGMNSENGVYAVNAANALDIAGKKEEALSLFLAAGKIFIKQGNNEEIAAMIPKLSNLGSENWEARVLIGKWAYSVNDYARCLVEFAASEKLKKDLRPRPKGDPAVYYLWGLASNIMGKNKNAVRLLERAVKLAPDYGLFRFKLAEIKITGGNYDRDVIKELKHALDFIDDGMKAEMASRAGNLLLNAGDAKNAKHFLNIAATGNPPEEQKESSDAGD